MFLAFKQTPIGRAHERRHSQSYAAIVDRRCCRPWRSLPRLLFLRRVLVARASHLRYLRERDCSLDPGSAPMPDIVAKSAAVRVLRVGTLPIGGSRRGHVLSRDAALAGRVPLDDVDGARRRWQLLTGWWQARGRCFVRRSGSGSVGRADSRAAFDRAAAASSTHHALAQSRICRSLRCATSIPMTLTSLKRVRSRKNGRSK